MTDQLNIFKKYIETEIGSLLPSWNELAEILSLREFRKGEIIVRESQLFKNEVFLAEGIIRVFLTGSDDQEVNIAFYEGPQVAAPYFTRNINHKHIASFQAVTACSVQLFDAEKFSDLIRKHIGIRNFAFTVVEKELKLKTRKEKCFLTQPASIRLEFFREIYPGLENRISQHHIASYLGISPVSLSRLRSSSLD
jgi:CRP-like cAMP-binding protein